MLHSKSNSLENQYQRPLGSTTANLWRLQIAFDLKLKLMFLSCTSTRSVRVTLGRMSAERQTKLVLHPLKPSSLSQVCASLLSALTTSAQYFIADLEDIKKQKEPSFTGGLSDAWGIEGEELKLSCYTNGYPVPEVTWLFNGEPLPKSNYYDVSYDGQEALLHLQLVKPEHAGRYTCKLKNKNGEAESSSELSVSTRPKFTERLQDVEVFKGEQACFSAKFSGYPAPDVTWFLNRQPLAVSSSRLL